LKKTIFSKNNTNSIYLHVINENKLQLDDAGKSALVTQIVKEMKNCYGRVKKDNVTVSNFNKVVTGVNNKVKEKMKKFLSDPKKYIRHSRT
jgi:truncated hemoglobin YjbI